MPRCARGCNTSQGLRGLCKVLLAATSCSGAFQPLPIVLLQCGGYFKPFPSLPVLFWPFLLWQTAWIPAPGAFLVQSGAVFTGLDFAAPRLQLVPCHGEL